jgi:hypothetical protein
MPAPGKTPIVGKGGAVNIGALQAVITRNQGTETEQTLTFTTNTTQTTPSSLRTDRKIAMYWLQVSGRLTNPGSGTTTLRSGGQLGSQLFNLIQLITVRGQHSVFGTQQPIYMFGNTMAELVQMYNPNYTPGWWNSVNAGALTKNAALSTTNSATNDFIFLIPIPLYPLGVAAQDIPSYCLNGPDWGGNLFMDIQCGDASVLYTTASATWGAFTQFQSTGGSPSIQINSIRPLLQKSVAASIVPAINFYTVNFTQPTTAVSTGASGSGIKIADLIVGRDTARVICKTGATTTAPTGSLRVYDSVSDLIITREYCSVDARPLPSIRGPMSNFTQSDYQALATGHSQPQGYQVQDFIETQGASSVANPKAALRSSAYGAARKFELDGDITAASGQIAEVVQELLLGKPGWNS